MNTWAIDQIRRRDRAPWPTEDLPEDPTWDDPRIPDRDLRPALDALAPKQRAAVIYRYLADLSYATVADLLDSNEAAAHRNAADGIAKLRRTYLQERTR